MKVRKKKNSTKRIAPLMGRVQGGTTTSKVPPAPLSMVKLLKQKLSATPDDTKSKADLLTEKLIEIGLGGKLEAIKAIIDRTEERALTEQEIEREVLRIYTIVEKHVSKLPKGDIVLKAIYRDLVEGAK